MLRAKLERLSKQQRWGKGPELHGEPTRRESGLEEDCKMDVEEGTDCKKNWMSERSTCRDRYETSRSSRTWIRIFGTGRKKVGRKSCKRLRGRGQNFCRSTRRCRRSLRSCIVFRTRRGITSRTLVALKKKCERSVKKKREGRRASRHVFRLCLNSRAVDEGKHIIDEEVQALQAGEERRGSNASQSNGCCFGPAMVEHFLALGAAQALQQLTFIRGAAE